MCPRKEKVKNSEEVIRTTKAIRLLPNYVYLLISMGMIYLFPSITKTITLRLIENIDGDLFNAILHSVKMSLFLGFHYALIAVILTGEGV